MKTLVGGGGGVKVTKYITRDTSTRELEVGHKKDLIIRVEI